jgi:hypothetical protein
MSATLGLLGLVAYDGAVGLLGFAFHLVHPDLLLP